MTPGDVNTASFYYANNPVSQAALGGFVERGYVEIGEAQGNTDYYFLDGQFFGSAIDSSLSGIFTELYNAYINDIVNGGNNTAQLAIDDAAIEAGRLGVPVSTIEEPVFDSAGHLVHAPTPVMTDVVQNSHKGLTLSGMSVAGSTVSVLDGSNPIGTATTDSSGNWSLQANISGQRDPAPPRPACFTFSLSGCSRLPLNPLGSSLVRYLNVAAILVPLLGLTAWPRRHIIDQCPQASRTGLRRRYLVHGASYVCACLRWW
jgi:hypothetical protein